MRCCCCCCCERDEKSLAEPSPLPAPQRRRPRVRFRGAPATPSHCFSKRYAVVYVVCRTTRICVSNRNGSFCNSNFPRTRAPFVSVAYEGCCLSFLVQSCQFDTGSFRVWDHHQHQHQQQQERQQQHFFYLVLGRLKKKKISPSIKPRRHPPPNDQFIMKTV